MTSLIVLVVGRYYVIMINAFANINYVCKNIYLCIYPANIYLFKVNKLTLEKGLKSVQS